MGYRRWKRQLAALRRPLSQPSPQGLDLPATPTFWVQAPVMRPQWRHQELPQASPLEQRSPPTLPPALPLRVVPWA
jgi:hypothetical protein